MLNLSELYQKVGLTEEQIQGIGDALKGQGSNGKDLELVIANNGEYVRAVKYDEQKTTLEQLQAQVQEKENEIARLKPFEEQNTTLQQELTSLKEESKKETSKLRKQFELEKLFINDKLPKINNGFDIYHSGINYDEITIGEDGKMNGINEAYTKFKTQNEELFKLAGIVRVEPPAGKEPTDPKEMSAKKFKGLSYEERLRLKQENPTIFNKYNKQ